MNPYILEMLRRDEGVMESAYQDSLGYWTIGVGRLIDARKGGRLSDDEIDYLLANDVAKVEKEARQFDWYDGLNDARKAVVLSMIFNLGITGFRGFVQTIKHLSAGNYQSAADRMMASKWAEQVGPRAGRLATIMRTGEVPWAK